MKYIGRILFVTFILSTACKEDDDTACFLQKYYLGNESGSEIEILLYDRNGEIELVKSWQLGDESKILFYETEGGHCLVENNFVGDSLVFVFENQKKNIFSCMNEAEFPFHVVYNNDCYTTLSDKNALYSHFFTRIVDGTTDLYYIITRLDYALAE